MDLPIAITTLSILTFLKYLHQNRLSPKVIQNYLASIWNMATTYGIEHSQLDNHNATRYIRSISINSTFRPTPRGIFDIPTLYQISLSCDLLSDPCLYRAIFLTSFYGFMRMSNIAPHSAKQFSVDRHFLRQDVIFGSPGAHLVVKWTKTLEDHRSHHVIQLPEISNSLLCCLTQDHYHPTTHCLQTTFHHMRK